jgi:hypothetical protein
MCVVSQTFCEHVPHPQTPEPPRVSQGERMQFTAHLQDIGPCDEQPRCEALIRFLRGASRESSL